MIEALPYKLLRMLGIPLDGPANGGGGGGLLMTMNQLFLIHPFHPLAKVWSTLMPPPTHDHKTRATLLAHGLNMRICHEPCISNPSARFPDQCGISTTSQEVYVTNFSPAIRLAGFAAGFARSVATRPRVDEARVPLLDAWEKLFF